MPTTARISNTSTVCPDVKTVVFILHSVWEALSTSNDIIFSLILISLLKLPIFGDRVIKLTGYIILLAELHGDLFGHHACPSEEAVLSVSVDETIVNVIKDPTKGRASPVTVTTDTPSPRGQRVQRQGFK